jgi:hypothetical protein
MNVDLPEDATSEYRVCERSGGQSMAAPAVAEEHTASKLPNQLGIVAAYGRRSFGALTRATSLTSSQEAAAERYAEQHGLQLTAVFADHGSTGATMDRAGLRAMLEDVESGRIDILIIEDIDRLSRDHEHLRYMAELFLTHGVTVHTVASGPLASGAMSALVGLAGVPDAASGGGSRQLGGRQTGAARPAIEG